MRPARPGRHPIGGGPSGLEFALRGAEREELVRYTPKVPRSARGRNDPPIPSRVGRNPATDLRFAWPGTGWSVPRPGDPAKGRPAHGFGFARAVSLPERGPLTRPPGTLSRREWGIFENELAPGIPPGYLDPTGV